MLAPPHSHSGEEKITIGEGEKRTEEKYSAPRTSGKEVQDVVIGIIVGGGGIELGDGRWDAVYGDRSVRWN